MRDSVPVVVPQDGRAEDRPWPTFYEGEGFFVSEVLNKYFPPISLSHVSAYVGSQQVVDNTTFPVSLNLPLKIEKTTNLDVDKDPRSEI